MDACARSEKDCSGGGSVFPPTIVGDGRAAQLVWTGQPDIARRNDEDGPEAGLLESAATPTEDGFVEMQGLVDSSSDDEDIPDVQLSVIK